MINRRMLIVGMVSVALMAGASVAGAASPVTVEIIALGHWPVQKALGPAREILKGFGDKVHLVEMDAESDKGKARLKSVGKHGHVPVLILINGKYRFTRENGSKIEFFSFPLAANGPLKQDGTWGMDDLKLVVTRAIGG